MCSLPSPKTYSFQFPKPNPSLYFSTSKIHYLQVAQFFLYLQMNYNMENNINGFNQSRQTSFTARSQMHNFMPMLNFMLPDNHEVLL